MLRAWQGCCECGIVGRVRNATSHVAVHPTHNVGRGIDATEAEGSTRLNLHTITRCSTFTYYTHPVRLLVRLVRRIEPVSYRATSTRYDGPRRGRGPPAVRRQRSGDWASHHVSVFAFAPLAFLGFARALWALGIGALPFRFAICFGRVACPRRRARQLRPRTPSPVPRVPAVRYARAPPPNSLRTSPRSRREIVRTGQTRRDQQIMRAVVVMLMAWRTMLYGPRWSMPWPVLSVNKRISLNL